MPQWSRQSLRFLIEPLFGVPRFTYLIAILYVALASVYAIVTPVFEKPDENWHFAFVMHVVEKGELPYQSLPTRNHYAEQQGSQPPLYYLTLAGLLKATHQDDLMTGFVRLNVRNSQFGQHTSLWPDNENVFVHGRCANECAKTERAVYIGRGLSILLGLIALCAAAWTVQLIFPDHPALLLIFVGSIAFNPQFLHISSSVSNDPMTFATVNLAFLVGFWWLKNPNSYQRVLVMGVMVGLAALSKPSGLSVGVIAGLLLLWAGRLNWQTRLKQLLLFGSIFFVVSGWWYINNLIQYGELTGVERHVEITGVRAPEASFEQIKTEWRGVGDSYWASFGWGNLNIRSSIPYDTARILQAVLAILFALTLFVRWRSWNIEQRWLIVLSVVQFVLVGALLARWMRMTVAPLGRLMYPAMIPISLMIALGWLNVMPQRLRGVISLGVTSLWAVVPIVLAVTLIPDAYRPTQRLMNSESGPIQMTFMENGQEKAVIRDLVWSEDQDWIYLQAYWEGKAEFTFDYQIFVHVLDSQGNIISQRDTFPGLGNRPTTLWQAGEGFSDIVVIPKPAGQTFVSFAIGLYRAHDGIFERLSVTSPVFEIRDNAVQIPVEQLRRGEVPVDAK